MRVPKTSPRDLCSTSSERAVVKRARRRSTQERHNRERELRFADLKLLVEQAPIGSIQAYARRLRKPSKTQHEALQDSVRAFGLVFPFLVDRHNLIGGHAVFEAAKALGLQTVPVIRASHSMNQRLKRCGLR